MFMFNFKKFTIMKRKDFGVIVDGYNNLNAVFHSRMAAMAYIDKLCDTFGSWMYFRSKIIKL